jgi:hypothetical protein
LRFVSASQLPPDPASGTLQHLKAKFGGTYYIEIKIPAARHEALTSFVSSTFTTSKLLEEPWQVQQRPLFQQLLSAC